MRETDISDKTVEHIIDDYESHGWSLDKFDVTEVYVPNEPSSTSDELIPGKRIATYYFVFRRIERNDTAGS